MTRKRLVQIGELSVESLHQRRHVSQTGELQLLLRILKDESAAFLMRGLAARALGNLLAGDDYVQSVVRSDEKVVECLVQLVEADARGGDLGSAPSSAGTLTFASRASLSACFVL